MADFNYSITEELGVISEKNGYSKEVNMISYNGAEPKVDIRNWSTGDDGEKKMGKGITLTKEEDVTIAEAIKALEDDYTRTVEYYRNEALKCEGGNNNG